MAALGASTFPFIGRREVSSISIVSSTLRKVADTALSTSNSASLLSITMQQLSSEQLCEADALNDCSGLISSAGGALYCLLPQH